MSKVRLRASVIGAFLGFSGLTLAAGAGAEGHRCFLFENADGHPVVHLDAARIDSVGTAISERNMALVERIDSAYREGRYGLIGESESRDAAFSALMYNSETAFDFFLELAMQESAIYSTSERDLTDAFTARFRNPGLYPIVNLLDARAGYGRFCVMFEVESEEKREIEITGEKMKAWTEQLEIDKVPTPVVNIDMKTMSHDRVHVIYERYSCGTVRIFETEQDGSPVRIATMEDLHGQYVRKWGFHRPAAVVLWKSPGSGIAAPPREARYLGSAIYFPRLRLKMPWFLPDLGFHDLRRFDFPEPLLTMQSTRDVQSRDLDWIEIKKNYRFANWEGQGDVPVFVEERFPDY